MNGALVLNRAICSISSLAVKSLLGRHTNTRRWCSALTESEMSSLPGSPNISITFLSSGSVLSPQKSLVIVTAHTSYLINAPEAMSRVLQESGAKFSKISHIFLTGNQWELCGGIIGTCLNISGAGLQSAVKLHGPPSIREVGNLMAKFSDTVGMKIEYNGAAEFSDSVFQVCSLDVRSKTDNAQSYSYLFTPHPLQAKLDMLKAVKMNFPVSMLKDGVTARRLKAGESVELPDGRMIDGRELLIQPTQAKAILVLDCATPGVADELATCQQLRRWIADGGVGLAVHLADAGLLRSDGYRSVIDLFQGSGVSHAVMDGRSVRPALYGAHQCQLMLNSLHDGVFPLLYGHRFMTREGEGETASSVASALTDDGGSFLEGATSCETYQEYHLRPPTGFESPAAAVESGRLDAFSEAALRAKVFEACEAHISRVEFAERMAAFVAGARADWPGLGGGGRRACPWVQFLGTVSSNPIKYRNVSSVLLHVSEDTKLLLDCGEGTLFQLMNFYGEADCQAVLRSVKAVCISHMHLDHQSGIFCLLRARRQAFAAVGQPPQPCAFVGPRGFSRWLEFFSNGDGGGLSDVLSVQDLDLYWSEVLSGMGRNWSDAGAMVARFERHVAEVLGLVKLTVVPVEHSTKVAFGFAVEGRRDSGGRPWKIVYSGDTVPCRSLVEAGRDCDLLIHEATFQDGLESEARAKKHSTVGQALAQAGAMRARHTILTHFSARYTTAVPSLRPPGPESGVGFAYDHMCAGLADLPRLARLTPMLPCLFPKHFAELERRSLRLAGAPALLPPPLSAEASASSRAVRRKSPAVAGKRRRLQGDGVGN